MEGVLQLQAQDVGRYLVAGRAFAAGQIILRETAYASSVSDPSVTCYHCYGQAAQLSRCSACKAAHFCSTRCQRAAWGAHRPECAALAAAAPRQVPATVRLAALVLWRAQREGGLGGEQPLAAPAATSAAGGGRGAATGPGRPLCASFADVQALVHHWDRLPDERKATFAQMAWLTCAYMAGRAGGGAGQEGPLPGDEEGQQHQERQAAEEDEEGAGDGGGGQPSVKDVAQLLARLSCNAHTICDEELRPLGQGLFPHFSLMNHSDTPNCMQSYTGSTVVVRAVRDIAAGEELSIAYLELAATRRERRCQLLDSYLFDLDLDQGTGGAAASQAAAAGAACGAPGQGSSPGGGGGVADEGSAGQAAASVDPVRYPLEPGTWLLCHPWQAPPSGSATSGGASAAAAAAAAGTLQQPRQRQPQLWAPWREDPRDAQLTEMVVAAGRGAGLVPVQGGMMGAWQPDEPGAGQGGPGDEAAAAQQRAAESYPWGAADGGTTGGGAAGAAAAAAAGKRGGGAPGDQPPTGQPHLEVECWGPGWRPPSEDATPAAAAGGTPQQQGPGSSPAACARATAARLGEVLRLQRQAAALAARGGHSAAVAALQRALQLADPPPPAAAPAAGALPAAGLGPCHVLRARLAADLLKAAVDSGSCWEVALAAARALVPCYVLVYPQRWPNLSLHYATLAKLEALCGDPGAALAAAEAALAGLSVTHPGSGVVEEAARLRWEAAAELQQQREAVGR